VFDSALQWLGFGLCHQLPERSFFGGGVQVPVCARDEGIYVGFVIAALLIWLLHRPLRPRELPNRWTLVVLAGMFGLMVLDGVLSYSGLRPTTNLMRLVTGLLAGYALAAIVMPLLNDELWRRAERMRVLEPPWRLGVWLASLPVVAAVVYYPLPRLGSSYPLLVAAAIIGTFLVVNLLLACTISAFERRAESWSDLVGPLAVALLLTAIEFVGAAVIKVVLLSLTV
jgi:uncharacterized membrane protein